MTIELSPQEHGLLVAMLERELGALSSEVRRTQTSSYRKELKDEEHVLRDLLKRLKAAAPG